MPDRERQPTKVPPLTTGDRLVLLLMFSLIVAALAVQYAFASGWGRPAPEFFTAAAQEHLINVNTAPAWELEALQGVGRKLAEEIILYREVHGPFKSLDDLKNVKGIGESTLERFRQHLTIGEPERPNVPEK